MLGNISDSKLINFLESLKVNFDNVLILIAFTTVYY